MRLETIRESFIVKETVGLNLWRGDRICVGLGSKASEEWKGMSKCLELEMHLVGGRGNVEPILP